jgi:hypothetical protein
MSRSVCDRCVQHSPTVYCWRLGDSRLEFDAPDRRSGPRDYDALRAAVSALLGGRPDDVAGAQHEAAREAVGGQGPTDAACGAMADRVHVARARAAARLRDRERG